VSKRILLIEDEDDIREVARMALELSTDWEIHDAPNGAAGIAAARSLRPDAILLDVMMPDMDGPSAFAQLQSDEDTREIPVMFLTAKVQPAERARLGSLGVRAVLAKPFDPMTLADEIRAVLKW
jgi:two-component system, OmpR family, alkaline phosphatase synthesis response regulator PhoP